MKRRSAAVLIVSMTWFTTACVVIEDGEVGEGEVLVFDLLDHPTAPKCYAWEVDGEVTVVLHESPVGNAQEAVRAAIMAGENKMENRDRFVDHEVIAGAMTGNPDFPEAVLCRVTNPKALNAEGAPWVVWPLHPDGSRGNGEYYAAFREGWSVLRRWVKDQSPPG